MPRRPNAADAEKTAEVPAALREDPTLDEACFLAALRRAVEGASTAAEERLARRTPDWSDRFGRICDSFAG